MRSDFSSNEVENQNQASQTNKELIIANLACSFSQRDIYSAKE